MATRWSARRTVIERWRVGYDTERPHGASAKDQAVEVASTADSRSLPDQDREHVTPTWTRTGDLRTSGP